MHEDLGRSDDVTPPSERSFGIVAAGFFAVLAFAPLLRESHGPFRWWALAASAIALGLAFFWTAPLRPLNRLWFRLGLVLYSVASPVALALLYFLVVAPTGLLMRACGKDPLRLRRDPTASSYWISREPPGPSPESMKNQF